MDAGLVGVIWVVVVATYLIELVRNRVLAELQIREDGHFGIVPLFSEHHLVAGDFSLNSGSKWIGHCFHRDSPRNKRYLQGNWSCKEIKTIARV